MPKADAEKQFKIARLLLEKGADASGTDGNMEAVLDYVVWRTFSGGDCVPLNDEYGKRAIVLMFAYGASAFYKAHFLKPIDKARLDSYLLKQVKRPDGSWGYGIVDKEVGEMVALLNI